MPTLQDLRQAAFLSQREVADRLHITGQTVSLWERGEKKPRMTYQRLLAEMYGVTPQAVREIVDRDFKGKKEATQ